MDKKQKPEALEAQEPEILKAYSFVWNIKNFLMSGHRTGEPITSPSFVVESLHNTKWHLQLYPNGESEDSKKYISIHIYREDDEYNDAVTIDYEMEVIDGNGRNLRNMIGENLPFRKGFFHGVPKIFRNSYLTLDEMLSWKDDILTVKCELLSEDVDLDRMVVSCCEAQSKIETDKCTFQWDIKFPASSRWKKLHTFYFLPLSLDIVISAPEDEFIITICPTERITHYRKIFCRFSLLNINEEEHISKSDAYVFNNTTELESWTFPSFFSKSMLLSQKRNFMIDYTFILACEISISTGTVTSNIEKFIFHPSNTIRLKSPAISLNMHSDLHADLREMFISKKLCDVKLNVKNKTFHAHKAMLAARSPVFAAMFEQDTLENKTGIVVIDDVDDDTMSSLLECIYTGSVKGLDYESAVELLIAANKYQMLSLRDTCSAFLTTILTVANVCNVLITADTISCQGLKVNALDFINNNFEKVLNSENWPDLAENNNKLATEVILNLSDALKKMVKYKK